MKKRIQIDSSLLFLIILFTGFLYLNRHIYFINRSLDNVLDFLGMMVVVKGVLLRMSARGYKKAHSQQGGRLVQAGPYVLTRNPMYLGSFLIGAGFVLILWPWWSLPIFALFFYLRFSMQIAQEEKHLARLFPNEFAAYCQKTPRLLPSLQSAWRARPGEIFNIHEAWSTKEKRGLLAWPFLAVILEAFQEILVFGSTDIPVVSTIFIAAIAVLILGLWVAYQR